MSKLEAIIGLVSERSPLQKKQLEKTYGLLSDDDRAAAERTLGFFTEKMGYSVGDVAEAYLWFVDTFMEWQMDFARTGKYRHSTYAEVEPYYKNDQLMKNYMLALALTFYMFPQHITINNFYNSILPQQPPPKIISHNKTSPPTKYLEIGSGHGHLFVAAMEKSAYDSYLAVDIAQSSVDVTAAYVEYCLPGRTNWQVRQMDFFDFDSSEQFDAIVMGEVLEHVEQPRKFLNKIRELAKDDAFIYISTAVNAPCFDHIYYFSSVTEVEQMFAECGLKVKDKVYATAGGLDFDKAVKKKATIVPAYLLEKC